MTPDENFALLSDRNETLSKAPTLAFSSRTKPTKEDVMENTKSTVKWYAKLLLMGFLTIAIPVSVYLAQQRLDMQQRAASPTLLPTPTVEIQKTQIDPQNPPTGKIVLDPNPCVLLPGESFCNSRVTFQFANATKIQICEKGADSNEKLLWESNTPNKITSFVHDKVASSSVLTITMRTQKTSECSGDEIASATLSAKLARTTPTPRVNL